MKKLFFDIETVPAPSEQHDVLRKLYEKRQARTRNGEFKQSFDDFVLSTSFSGTFGRLVCVALAADDEPADVLWGEETEMLRGFWSAARNKDRLIGHNIYDFDFPFLIKRSRVLGIKPSVRTNIPRYRQEPLYDTLQEWNMWSSSRTGTSSLDALAKAMGLPTSKDDLDGSQVWPAYQAGKIEEICEYCKKDVELTRQIYRRMEFES